MSTFSYYSARVRTRQHANGLHIAEYTGFFNGPAWRELGHQVERERAHAPASIDLAYAAVNDTEDRLDDVDFNHLIGSPPGVWVARPAQYESFLHLARRLADVGVTRTVFLQAFEPLALEFAARQCPVLCQ